MTFGKSEKDTFKLESIQTNLEQIEYKKKYENLLTELKNEKIISKTTEQWNVTL